MKKTLANNFLKLPPELMSFICKSLDYDDLSNLIKAFGNKPSLRDLKSEVKRYMNQNFKINDTSKENIINIIYKYNL